MRHTPKSVMVMLGIVAALDVVSALLSTRVTGDAKPPGPAIASIWVFAALTLVALYGLWRGARGARPLTYGTLGIRIVSSLLGLGNIPSTLLLVIGSVNVVLSVAVIIKLARAGRQAVVAARLETESV